LRAARQAANEGRDAFLDTYEGCSQILQARDGAKNRLKSIVLRGLGDRAPGWIHNAGCTGLKKLAGIIEDSALKDSIETWAIEDARYREMHRKFSARIQARLRKNYEWVAHDIGQILQGDGIRSLVLEARFLREVAQSDHSRGDALQRGARYRQWVAPATLAATIEKIVPKYGVRVIRLTVQNRTRCCHYCGRLNESGQAGQFYECEGCQKMISQDENAALNLARAFKAGAVRMNSSPR
jgi:hypothetical protein